ncbi:MAG: hypothetical protein ACYCZF_05985, partial [Anaerolineae bacterium]
SIWYNNIAMGQTVTCFVGPIVALPLMPASITNPSLTANGIEITFPVTMESGDYLEFDALTGCTHYGSKGEIKGLVQPQGGTPALVTGANDLSFRCAPTDGPTPRLAVTTISLGAPL